MPITEVNEILEQVASGELTQADAQKLLGTHRDEELGRVRHETPAPEQLSIFTIILALLLLQLLYDALFIYGLLENWDQTFLSFIIGMALLTFGLMLDLYRRSFLPDVLETKRRRAKIVPKLER